MEWPPARVPRALAPFTLHKDGWVRWYRGKTRFIAGRTVDVEAVEKAWEALKKRVDSDAPAADDPDSLTLRELFGLFMARQRRRMETGKPRPLSPFTFRDYTVILAEFIRFVGGGGRSVADLNVGDFERYAHSLEKLSPVTYGRKVACIRAMFNWGAKAEHIRPVRVGPDFVPPPAQARRDRRLAVEKSYAPAELQALWRAARREEKAWIALGLNCAFDNSDVSTLTWDCVDLAKGMIDFRRRKVGKVRRVIPLCRRTRHLLAAMPRGDGPIFTTPTGLPLVRLNPSKRDPNKQVSIDHIAMRWDRLMREAGLRKKVTTHRVDGRRRQKREGKGDGRGFRALRTTFANLAPVGYRDEIEIVMGHSQGTVFLDNYLEQVGLQRLRELVEHVWRAAFTPASKQGQASGSAGPGPAHA